MSRSRGDSPGWYADSGEYMRGVNEHLRERPSGGPEPTAQDLYYEGRDDPESEPSPYMPDLWDDPEYLEKP